MSKVEFNGFSTWFVEAFPAKCGQRQDGGNRKSGDLKTSFSSLEEKLKMWLKSIEWINNMESFQDLDFAAFVNLVNLTSQFLFQQWPKA